jgi:hypothetical protein
MHLWQVQLEVNGKTGWYTGIRQRDPQAARRFVLRWLGLEASETPYRVLQVRPDPSDMVPV